MADLAAAYVETYEHIVPILRGLTPEQLETKVPFSPEWSVRDVAAHMTSEAEMIVYGDIPEGIFYMDEARRDERAGIINAFNAEHLERRRQLGLEEILAEWEAAVPAMLEALRGERPFKSPYPGQDYVAVVDLAMHSQDIRNLVGRPGDRESAGVGYALPSFGFVLSQRITEVGLPALELRYDGKTRVLGEGEPGASITASRYELVRALANRRSTAQIRAYDWTGDRERYLPIIPAYQPRDDDIFE
ncbi:MAG: maleylpyruvate isomerase family mycothiol-dependent enzyme [Candidatus Dormiibacterota bacterium]